MALQLNVVGTTGLGSRLLLLVHGYGADEHDLAPLAPYLDPEGRYFTVCPRGPLTVEPFGGASWYDFADGGADEATFEGARLAAWRLRPVHIYSLHQPQWASEAEAQEILDRVQQASEALPKR